ncbi:MAG: inner membrane CreD family protein [Halanaerobiales bacterium]
MNKHSEITEKWGQEQTIGGPVLTIPFEEYYENQEGEVKTRTRLAHFLPDFLNITGTISPEIRYRSLYKTFVYNSDIEIEGEILSPRNTCRYFSKR